MKRRKVERASTFPEDVSKEKHLQQFAINRAQKIPGKTRCQKAVKTNDNASELNGKYYISFRYLLKLQMSS